MDWPHLSWKAHSCHFLFLRHSLPFSLWQRLFWFAKGWMSTSACALHYQGAHNYLAMGLNMILVFIHGKSSFNSSLPDLFCHFLFVNHLPFAELITFCFFPFHSVPLPALTWVLIFLSLHPFPFLSSFSAPFFSFSSNCHLFLRSLPSFSPPLFLPLWFIIPSSVGTSNHRYP